MFAFFAMISTAKMVEQKGMHSSSPVRTHSQLTAEQTLTGEC